MSYYKGRVALVTGASNGIGSAIAETLVKEGLIVIGASRNVSKIEELGQKLTNESGRLIPKALDVRKDEEIVALYKWAETELVGIDVVVNNAGVIYYTQFHKLTTEQMKSTIETNLVGLAVSSREAINSMIRRNVQDGFIVNINSVSGHTVPHRREVGLGVYSPSKFGVTSLCKTLRYTVADLGLQTRITSISPGLVKSGFTAEFIDKGAVDKYLEPEDVAKAVSFVLNMPPSVEIPELTIGATGSVR